MQALLTVIATWLSINYGLPATQDYPKVETAAPVQMAAVRHRALAAVGPQQAAESGSSAPADGGENVFAIYDDATRTIYLHDGWTGITPADSSLLVHEMVHHLQNAAGMTFACAGEREKDAYRAQARWLELFGRSLEDEFGIDAMTILVRTNCMG
jgi:hypothetical protein